MFFLVKTVISGLVIAFSSWLAGRKPLLAGYIVSLPLISLLSIVMSYIEYRDMNKINQFAVSILVAVPLSLSFFIPFVLNRWLKMGFPLTLALSLGCVFLAYVIHHRIMEWT